jgi:hypothetical protein
MKHDDEKGSESYPGPTSRELAELRALFKDEQPTDQWLAQLHRELQAWADLLLDIYTEKRDQLRRPQEDG